MLISSMIYLVFGNPGYGLHFIQIFGKMGSLFFVHIELRFVLIF